MAKKTNKKTEVAENIPAHVRELLENGNVVLSGRTYGEIYELLAAIPSDVVYDVGTVTHHMSIDAYRLQINLREK